MVAFAAWVHGHRDGFMRMGVSGRALILMSIVWASVSCGSVASPRFDASPSRDGAIPDGTGGATAGGSGGAGGAGGTNGAGGAGGTNGAGGAGSGGAGGGNDGGTAGTGGGIRLHGSIGTLGAAPAAAGAIRLVDPHLSVPGLKLCNASTCLVSGGIVP